LTKLSTALLLILEVHCMAGLRDPYFASVGRAPIKVTVTAKDDDWGLGKCKCAAEFNWVERGEHWSGWYRVLSDDDGHRIQPGRSYSLVKVRSIKFADPFTIEHKGLWRP
jgi:hypothetical protein